MIVEQQRFLEMAEQYDRMAPLMVPMYDWMQEEMLRVTGTGAMPEGRIVDLGAGSGIFLEKALASNPCIRGVWVDSSPAFLEVAQRRLARFGARVTYVMCQLQDRWEDQLGGPADALVSMSAIHHLESKEKRALYKRCCAVLGPGGWFVNCDEMMADSQEAYLSSLHAWAKHVDVAGQRVSPEMRDHYEGWTAHFARWKERNIQGFGKPKQRGDDLHETYRSQLSWLRRAGFEEVDLFAKYHLWCMIGGRKPAAARAQPG